MNCMVRKKKLCFRNTTIIPIQSLATKIISLASFWCKSRGKICPCDTKKLVSLVETLDREQEDMDQMFGFDLITGWRCYQTFNCIVYILVFVSNSVMSFAVVLM